MNTAQILLVFLSIATFWCADASDSSKRCNVRDYNAKGNGENDDTDAFKAAAANCTGGVLYLPTGNYAINSAIVFDSKGDSPLTIQGDGWESKVLWTSQNDLFVWKQEMSRLLLKDFMIESTGENKDPALAALRFAGGLTQSTLSTLLFSGGENSRLGSAMDLGPLTDTVTIHETVVWFTIGTAVKIGRGSEVRIEGGRLIGPADPNDEKSIGVHVTGNNGGVHVVSTDVIGLHEGIRLDDSNGQGSNREVFLSQATIDSNWRGVSVCDNTYVDISSVWAASSRTDNIWVSPESTNAILSLTGGTIFNAGAAGCDNPSSMCNGLVVNAGSFTLTGVHVRNNKGRGIWLPSDKPNNFVLSGNKIYSNGQGLEMNACTKGVISSNVLNGNTDASRISSCLKSTGNVCDSTESSWCGKS